TTAPRRLAVRRQRKVAPVCGGWWTQVRPASAEQSTPYSVPEAMQAATKWPGSLAQVQAVNAAGTTERGRPAQRHKPRRIMYGSEPLHDAMRIYEDPAQLIVPGVSNSNEQHS